jgi:hypothetical protein
MPLTDAYDLSGLNDDRFLCGPYVCTPFANEQLPSQFEIDCAIRDLEPQARMLPGAVPDNGYSVLDVFSSSTVDSLFSSVSVHKKIRDYPRAPRRTFNCITTRLARRSS